MNITARTRLAGILGYPVRHSLSPAMHNAAFAALGMDWCYLPLEVPPKDLGAALRGLAALGFAGANLTMPHKEQALAYLDELAPEALTLGAVNTVVVGKEGQLIGHNTDVFGFLRALATWGLEVRALKAVVLGAGGAARAVTWALLRAGAEVTIANRTAARAQRLALDLAGLFGEAKVRAIELAPGPLSAALDRGDLLVNATPVGLWPQVQETPLPPGARLPARLAVFDLVYNPIDTNLMCQARAAGGRAMGGLEMLVQQGAQAFRLWTGMDPPVAEMRRAARQELEASLSMVGLESPAAISADGLAP